MPIDIQRLRTEFAGRYAVEETIGSGGMSTVFRAVDLHHDRQVAIKILLPELSAGSGADRFRREIETAARLTHPRIIPLFDSGEISGLLYYVMPYVDGESLRQRLEREHQLPIEEALRITHEVGEALTYAHSRGIVHRDIKPGNVMLTAGGAAITDFGIARAAEMADVAPLTRTGQSIGTAGYMSPEQASGDRTLDHRSDLYGLACVLFEMLAGEPPYVGSTPQSILAKQLNRPVPSVTSIRDTTPAAVDAALQRALAKSPADRFGSVEEFLEALQAEPAQVPDRIAPGPSPRVIWLVAIAGVLAFATWLTLTRDGTRASDTGVVADTSRYAIFPFEYPGGAGFDLGEIQRLEDALDDWQGLSLVSAQRMRRDLEAFDQTLTIEDAARLARNRGAGRFIWGEARQLGDSIRVRAALYDALSNGVQLTDQAFRMATSGANADSLFRSLADHLLFRGDPPDDEPAGSSRSLPAVKDMRRGLGYVDSWDLPAADDAFESARDHDPEYARAQLWLALVRRWQGRPETEWELAADRAALKRASLPESERAVSDALLAEARGDLADACPIWAGMTVTRPEAFVPWYGLAHCLTTDSTVVRDPDAVSGWAFRTSYHQALEAYEEAFRFNPAILRSSQRTSYQPLQELFKVAGNQLRRGKAETGLFEAYPSLADDTIAFVPYPSRAGRVESAPDPAAVGEAVIRLREKLVEVTRTWAVQEPKSGSARHALGIALALTGNPSALDTLQAARELMDEASDRQRVMSTTVWVQVAEALPEDLDGLRRARSLADSLLVDSTAFVPLDPELSVGLATLTGRAALAAQLARQAAGRANRSPNESFAGMFSMPAALANSAPALFVFAALGGPPDSLRVLSRAVTSAIETRLSPDERTGIDFALLVWPATQAFPTRWPGADDLPKGDPLFDAQNAWVLGDAAAARAGLEAIGRERRHVLPPHRTMDSLYPEATLWWLLGEPDRAARWLDPTFASLSQVHPAMLSVPPNAGALVRAAALRAHIARALGQDDAAITWARAVVTLWSDADAFQLQTVEDMRRLIQGLNGAPESRP